MSLEQQRVAGDDEYCPVDWQNRFGALIWTILEKNLFRVYRVIFPNPQNRGLIQPVIASLFKWQTKR